MLTVSDFQRSIRDTIDAYPSIAPLYHAGDPRIIQHLDAMATMLAMLSAQLEVAQAEPFEKVRDATVLADAAMRGIVPKGKPARVRLKAVNTGNIDFLVESGRTLLDSSGLLWRVETSAVVPANSHATFEAVQHQAVTITHIVKDSEPFYAIQVPVATDDASHLCAITVSDAIGQFEYRDRYVNTAVDERVFHVEADDQQRVYVRFGFTGIVAHQPVDGTQITLDVLYTAGDVTPAYGSPFSFEYLRTPAESVVELRMDALLMSGQNPMPMATLRDFARYPSIYDSNAVYLGEFDFLVRRNFPTLQFLSVWNESAEERARGPKLENINAVFVSCLSKEGVEQTLMETDASQPTMPVVIQREAWSETQSSIATAIGAADDSYRIYFFTPVVSKIHMQIRARVSTSYVASNVRKQISEALLSEFGKTAAASKRGRQRPLYQRVYALLRQKIEALSVGAADLTVEIEEPVSQLVRPEMWRYLADDTLVVDVETANIITPAWGG